MSLHLPRRIIAGSAYLTVFVGCTAASLAGTLSSNPEFSFGVGGQCGEINVPPGSDYEEWRDITLTTSNNPTVGTNVLRTCFATDQSGDFVFTQRTGRCDFGDVDNAFFDPYARDPRDVATLGCGDSLSRPDGTREAIECFEEDGQITEISTYDDLGAEGWSWSLVSEGALSIVDTTTAGTVSANFRDGGLERGGFVENALASSGAGATSVVVLAQTLPVTLPPEGTEVILRVLVRGNVPTRAGQTAEGRLWWAYREQDLLSGGGKPVDTLVVYKARAVRVAMRGDPPLNESDLIGCSITFSTETLQTEFTRGDANTDGQINIADAVSIFGWLFQGGDRPGCLDAADTNDKDGHNITDGIYLLDWLFQGASVPPAPGPFQCGPDETEDSSDCERYDECP